MGRGERRGLFATAGELLEMRPVVRLEGLRLAQAVVRADCALPPPSGRMSFDRIDRTVHGG